MLKLRENKMNDLYLFFARRDVQKLTFLTAKFQKDPREPLRDIAWRSYCIQRTLQFWSSEQMSIKILGVDALLPMLCRLPFSKPFQSDNHVYRDLNKSTLDFLYLALSKSFLSFETVKLCWLLWYN